MVSRGRKLYNLPKNWFGYITEYGLKHYSEVHKEVEAPPELEKERPERPYDGPRSVEDRHEEVHVPVDWDVSFE